MNSRKKFFLAFIFIIVDAFLIVGFLVIRDATNINKLEKEMNHISMLNFASTSFDSLIKTNGGYGVVESSIKGRLRYFANSIEEVSELVNDPKLAKVLSYDNYREDGPEFSNSLTYLEDAKYEFNSKIDEVLDVMSDDSIRDYITTRTNDKYYISLYNKYMFKDEIMANVHESKDLLNKTKVRVNNVFDVSIDVLNFLNMYKEHWKLEDGEIKFETEELYNYYISLISKVQVQ